MKKHTVKMVKEEGTWLVKYPEFQGCHSNGATIEEASKNIKEAIACCDNTPESEMYNKELDIVYITIEEWYDDE